MRGAEEGGEEVRRREERRRLCQAWPAARRQCTASLRPTSRLADYGRDLVGKRNADPPLRPPAPR